MQIPRIDQDRGSCYQLLKFVDVSWRTFCWVTLAEASPTPSTDRSGSACPFIAIAPFDDHVAFTREVQHLFFDSLHFCQPAVTLLMADAPAQVTFAIAPAQRTCWVTSRGLGPDGETA